MRRWRRYYLQQPAGRRDPASVTAETTRAEGAETLLTTNLNSEVSRAQGAESTLTSNLNSEVSRATSTETALGTAVTTESAARVAGDLALSTGLSTEVMRATNAETGLGTSVTTETTRATAAEATKADINAPVLATATLPSGVCSPVNAMQLYSAAAAGQQLYICHEDPITHALSWSNANDESALQATLSGDVTAEAAARAAADALELARATGAEATLTTNLATETTRATGAENTLTTNLNGEVSRATGAETALNTAVTAEGATRAAADAILTTGLNGEITRAATAESAEMTRAVGAETNLQNTKADLLAPVVAVASQPSGLCSPANAMQLYSAGAAGQQLFICRLDTASSTMNWVNANDESAVNTSVVVETNRAEGAELILTTNLNSEVSRAQGAESTLTANLATETSRAQGAETTETTRATGAETALGTAVTTESAARVAGDLSLSTGISSEATRAGNAETALGLSVTAETTRATTAEATKADLIAPVVAVASSPSGPCTTVNAVQLYSAGSVGQQLFICREAVANDPSSAVWSNANDESILQNNVTASVTAEATRAEAAETTLTNNLSSEVTRATAAESTLTSNLATEAGIRASTDTSLGTSIAGETSRAQAAEWTITNSLAAENTRALAAEATKANLAGDNTFIGNQTVNGAFSLPALPGGGAQASQSLTLAGTDGTNANLFRWQVTSAGKLDLITASGGNAAADSGFMIGPDGKIIFAVGQTFPGTTSGTVTNVATGAGLTGGPITSTGTISIATGGVTNAMLSNPSLTVAAGTGLSGGGAVPLGGTVTLTNAGVTSITGTASQVTASASTGGVTLSLPATINVNTSGNAATATSAATATTAASATNFTGVLAGDVTGTQAATVVSKIGGVTAANFARTDQTNTFTGQNIFGNTAAGSGGLLIPPSASGAQKVSFPLDMEATNTGNNLHLFRIIAQDGGTPNWNFQFCNTAPCTPASNGLSIAGSSGLITFATGQTFPGAGAGTVTSVATGAGLTGGPITSTGTVSIATAGVTNAMLANSSTTINTANGLTGGGSVALGGTLSLSTNATTAATANTLALRDASGNLTAAAFSGSGSSLTNLVATNISAGTAGISITGNAATATTAASATTATTANTATSATTAGNVTGIVATANGGTGVNSSATAPNLVLASPNGSSGAPSFRAIASADLPTAHNTRAICYVAGADNNTTALDTTFSQKSFFANMIGPMTAVANGLRCQTDAGTATIQVNKNGGAAGTLSNTLSCTTTWGANAGSFASTSIASNDMLDFNITATAGAKRVTVCLSATVN